MQSIDIGNDPLAGGSYATVAQKIPAGPSRDQFLIDHPIAAIDDAYDWAVLQTALDNDLALELPKQTYWIGSKPLMAPKNGRARFYGDGGTATRIIGNTAGPVFCGRSTASGGPLYLKSDDTLTESPSGGMMFVDARGVQFYNENPVGTSVCTYNLDSGSRFDQCRFWGRRHIFSQSFDVKLVGCAFTWNEGSGNNATDPNNNWLRIEEFPTFEAYLAKLLRLGTMISGHVTVDTCVATGMPVGFNLQGASINLFGGRAEMNGIGHVHAGPNFAFDNLWAGNGYFLANTSHGHSCESNRINLYTVSMGGHLSQIYAQGDNDPIRRRTLVGMYCGAIDNMGIIDKLIVGGTHQLAPVVFTSEPNQKFEAVGLTAPVRKSDPLTMTLPVAENANAVAVSKTTAVSSGHAQIYQTTVLPDTVPAFDGKKYLYVGSFRSENGRLVGWSQSNFKTVDHGPTGHVTKIAFYGFGHPLVVARRLYRKEIDPNANGRSWWKYVEVPVAQSTIIDDGTLPWVDAGIIPYPNAVIGPFSYPGEKVSVKPSWATAYVVKDDGTTYTIEFANPAPSGATAKIIGSE